MRQQQRERFDAKAKADEYRQKLNGTTRGTWLVAVIVPELKQVELHSGASIFGTLATAAPTTGDHVQLRYVEGQLERADLRTWHGAQPVTSFVWI